MKKLIAILMVLAIVVGAAFAVDETHTLNVSVTLTEIVPQFALKYNSTDSNTAPAEFGAHSYTIENQATTAGDDIVADNAITVEAYVLNAARQKKTYTLTFSGGEFDASKGAGYTSLKINGNATVANPTIRAAASDAAITGIGTIEADGAEVSVPFNGTKMTATEETLLGSATYTYDVDWDTVDPDTYTTNIILTISAS